MDKEKRFTNDPQQKPVNLKKVKLVNTPKSSAKSNTTKTNRGK